MVIENILVEETHRQDNQYASLVAKLRLNGPLTARLESGAIKLSMAFAAKAVPAPKKGKKAKGEENQVKSYFPSFLEQGPEGSFYGT